MNNILHSLLLFAALLLTGCDFTGSEGEPPDADERLAGGETTVVDATSHAFSTPALNLSGTRLDEHLEGDLAFEQTFVTAPAIVNSGLGPIYNQTSCIACHVRVGRSRESLLLRVSMEGQAADGGPVPVPGYGKQIQDVAVFGVQPEAQIVVEYADQPETLADGTVVMLRVPTYRIENPYAPLPAHVQVSPRMARPVFGLGLLEAISEATLLALAAEQNSQADGISGKPNYVWNVQEQQRQIGRFGWKANQPTLLQQTADAYRDDMGVTSALLIDENSIQQIPHLDGLDDDPEIDQRTLDVTTFYTQTLAVPSPRTLERDDVRRGKALFAQVGCASCHVPQIRTGTLAGVSEVSNQTIFPYTDLLLHDMGPGLADGRPDFEADGQEWRTPPLWGIGLSAVVTGHTLFLHDGRARNLLEAIMWHGGEAEGAREQVRTLSTEDREALLAFLSAL